ncbi:ATPase, T2SS/T4P/T4SS family [Achromobacter spanius]|uniref:ATPase, T2SS/T4P/T4SS family n=1 Tax=Achromobacter spanius TaxID=217203 RepID=UPI0038271875
MALFDGEKKLAQLVLPPGFSGFDFELALQSAHAMGISDLTFQSKDYVFGHDQGRWVRLNDRRLEHRELEQILAQLYGSTTGSARLLDRDFLDFAAVIQESPGSESWIRFRTNATLSYINGQSKGFSITMRRIPGAPPRFEDLPLPAELRDNFLIAEGLAAVIGTTGSGKTTLLAAANRARLEGDSPVRILIYEDTQEYIYDGLAGGRMPEPSQAIIGDHLKSYDQSGPNAMRRKGDVIIVGETRDRASMTACFEMAASGHATYHTSHTKTPDTYFTRTVNMFPEDVQPDRASQLVELCRLICGQKLYRALDGRKHALQSWVVLDRECVEKLESVEFKDRARLIRGLVEDRGASFRLQALPEVREGLITFRTFMNLTGMTPPEGREFLQHHGIDSQALPANEFTVEAAA